jgi:hypothetical protein
MVNVLAVPGSGYTVDPSGKSVTAPFGATVTLGVYAIVSGTNATQFVDDLDGDADAPDTRNDDGLDIIAGSFQSIGGLLVNLNTSPGQLTYNSRATPFNGGGSSNGTARDWDSDGDLDIGGPGFDSPDLWFIRSGAMTFAAKFDGTSNGWVNGDLAPGGGVTGSGLNSEDRIIDPTSAVLRVGTLRAIVSGGTGTTALNHVLRTVPGPGTALWWEDDIATGKTAGAGAVTVGTPVTIAGIPEPASVGVLGIASVGLLARRKR